MYVAFLINVRGSDSFRFQYLKKKAYEAFSNTFYLWTDLDFENLDQEKWNFLNFLRKTILRLTRNR